MATPTFNLPTSGSDPKRATKEGLEDSINSIIQYLDDARIAGDDRGTEGFYNAGPWDASTGAFPTVRGQGGAVQNGDTFFVQDGGAGVVDGQPQFEVGQRIIAQVDNPSSTTYADNWERANTIAILEPLTARVDAMSVPFDTVADFFAANLADIKAKANVATGLVYIKVKNGSHRYIVDLEQNLPFTTPPACVVEATVIAGDGGFSVLAFGATGDGVTNDTVSIQKAIDVGASSGVPTVFPAKTYVFTTLTIPQVSGGVALRGMGTWVSGASARGGAFKGATLLSTVTSGNLISADGGAGFVNRGIEISGLNIVGGTSDYLISITASPDNNVLERLGLYNTNPSGGSGINLVSAWVNTRITNVNCEAATIGSGTIGLNVNNALAAGGLLVEASRFGRFETNVLHGIRAYQAKYSVVGMESGKYGFRGNGGGINGVSLDTCHFEYNEDHAIWIEKVNAAQVNNCSFFRNSEGASGTKADVFVSGASGFENYNVSIRNCRNFGLSADTSFIYIQNSALNSGDVCNNQASNFGAGTGRVGLNLTGGSKENWTVDANFFQSVDTPYIGANEARYFSEALTAVQGIRFEPGASSPNANTLTAYQSGNFTPLLSSDTGITDNVYSRQVGRYQLIGDVVTFSFDIQMTAEGSTTASEAVLDLNDIPFVISASPGAAQANICNFENLGTAVTSLQLWPKTNQKQLYFRALTAAATSMSYVGSNSLYTNTTRIVGGGWFKVQ